MAMTMRESATGVSQRIPVWPLIGLAGLAAVSGFLGPEIFTMALIGLTGITVVGMRPYAGLAILLFMLMVQYGARPAFSGQGGGGGGLSSLVPQGTGLLSVNNVLGVFLLSMLIYQVRKSGDWSFLKNPSVQLVLAVTVVLVVSAYASGITVAQQVEVGIIPTTGEDPSRMLVSRALFVVLFVFFVKNPRDLRLIVGLFVVLSVITAWTGSTAAMSGEGMAGRAPGSTGYRAGGAQVLLESTANPNRLAMIATLALVYIWEYSESFRRKLFRVASLGVILLLVVTVFLSASRGGLIGLVFAGVMMFVRRSGGSGRWLYGLVAIAIAGGLIQEVVPEEALDRITNIPGLSSQEDVNSVGRGSVERREYTIGIGIKVWEQEPLIGVGPGNWSYVRFLIDPMRSAGAAHNSYLHALAEGGIVGASLYMLLLYITIRDVLRCERDPAIIARARSEGLEWILVATRICLLSFMVFSVFADLWDLIFFYFLIAVSTMLVQRYLRFPTNAWSDVDADAYTDAEAAWA